jgi:hypothetical protein
MSDPREEILFAADENFWRAWVENKEMLAQLRDSKLAKGSGTKGRNLMLSLKEPSEIELNPDAFKQWIREAEKLIDGAMTNALEQLKEIGVAMDEVKRLWWEIKSEV